MVKFWRWFKKNYLLILLIFLSLYLLGSFMPPFAMKNELRGFSRLIYSLYGTCHQFAFRSFFLFGEQPFYPREMAGLRKYQSYESATGLAHDDLISAREFVGNTKIGFKIALCQRDLAMYSGLIISLAIFLLSNKTLRPLHGAIFIFLGILPIAIDGISQLGSTGLSILPWFPVRESTPLLRILTGGLFGLLSGFYLFPRLESSIRSLILQYESKD